jgi:hypothetical protein
VLSLVTWGPHSGKKGMVVDADDLHYYVIFDGEDRPCDYLKTAGLLKLISQGKPPLAPFKKRNATPRFLPWPEDMKRRARLGAL